MCTSKSVREDNLEWYWLRFTMLGPWKRDLVISLLAPRFGRPVIGSTKSQKIVNQSTITITTITTIITFLFITVLQSSQCLLMLLNWHSSQEAQATDAPRVLPLDQYHP